MFFDFLVVILFVILITDSLTLAMKKGLNRLRIFYI